MIIQAVVEGHGEVASIPVLLRRLAIIGSIYDLQVLTPIRYGRDAIVHGPALGQAVGLARSRNADWLLVLFDADDDCPVEVASTVADRLAEVAPDIEGCVVVAQREYEAWFLGAIESLRGRRDIAIDAASDPNPEGWRGAKEEVTRRMAGSRAYASRADQPALTAIFAMEDAYRTCRSFRRMISAFGQMAGLSKDDWPPPALIGS